MVKKAIIKKVTKNYETIGNKLTPKVANWKAFSMIFENNDQNNYLKQSLDNKIDPNNYLKQFLDKLDEVPFTDIDHGCYSKSYRKFAYIMKNLKFLATNNFLQVAN